MANIKNGITYLNRTHTISIHSEQDKHSTQPPASNGASSPSEALQGEMLWFNEHMGGAASDRIGAVHWCFCGKPVYKPK